jgi:hypothetical protein
MKQRVPVPGTVNSMTAVVTLMVAALIAYGSPILGTSADRPAVAAPAPAGPARPALGNYTYAVDGEEGATGFGSRRFPEQMTTVVHGGPGLAPDEVVFDITYSQEHVEREIVAYRGDGVYFTFEGGQVSFGPATQTSEAEYDPPMLQIPWPLQPGATRTGTSKAKRGDGSVVRTENWTATVVGVEPVMAAGGSVEAWKVEVDRKSQPGSAEQLVRHRTYWYDPGRGIWVQFAETVHGERKTGPTTFTYDSRLTATLTGFTPG